MCSIRKFSHCKTPNQFSTYKIIIIYFYAPTGREDNSLKAFQGRLDLCLLYTIIVRLYLHAIARCDVDLKTTTLLIVNHINQPYVGKQ